MSKYEPQIVSHGACGTRWTQRGDHTSHCSGCHRTFAGLQGFDRHQKVIDGRAVCYDPVSLFFDAKVDPNTGITVWSQPQGAVATAWLAARKAERDMEKSEGIAPLDRQDDRERAASAAP